MSILFLNKSKLGIAKKEIKRQGGNPEDEALVLSEYKKLKGAFLEELEEQVVEKPAEAKKKVKKAKKK